MATPSMATINCPECRRSVPVTRARRVRAHATVPGGQAECSASRGPVIFRAFPVAPPVLPPRPLARSLPGQWCGPRRWEDADF